MSYDLLLHHAHTVLNTVLSTGDVSEDEWIDEDSACREEKAREPAEERRMLTGLGLVVGGQVVTRHPDLREENIFSKPLTRGGREDRAQPHRDALQRSVNDLLPTELLLLLVGRERVDVLDEKRADLVRHDLLDEGVGEGEGGDGEEAVQRRRFLLVCKTRRHDEQIVERSALQSFERKK